MHRAKRRKNKEKSEMENYSWEIFINFNLYRGALRESLIDEDEGM